MRTDLPTGTLTFLFTDIEGSTKLAAALGDERWTAVLERHQEILRECFTSRGGIEVATEGDSFFVVFPSAPGAIAAAVAAQQQIVAEPWAEDAIIRVRMGLHTGEGTLGADNYVGLDVHRAARVAAAGHGGQVLISAATRSLAEQSLPEGVTLRDLGEHRLKDLALPERLAMLVVPGCPTEFPPLRTVDAVPNNLPLQLTSFIGREKEVAEASRLLLDSARLVTLTGPGGTGKTRLSLQVAAEVSDSFPDGVFFVPLAPISDATLVPSAIAQALQIPVAGNQPVDERLRDWLKGKRLLLVLDNFEQVQGAGPLVADLLRSEESLRMLITSRSPLRLYGEREYPVPSLRLPKRLPDDPERLSQFEAVRLFIERAVAVRPDFQVTNENAPSVAMICSRLDGLPLAIELAAARIKVLSPQAILPRLEKSLDLLSSGARDLPERQRTLRGAITWSWDLLSEGHRRLFTRFSVFVGGARLEQAQSVCEPDLDVDVLDGLSELVDQSLVRQIEEADGEPRFSMLATIREYALERLAESDEAEAVRRRHAESYVELVELAEPDLTGPLQGEWLTRLDREHDNLRAAIQWATERGEAALALRLVAAPWRFWQFRGHLREAAQRQAAALALPKVVEVDPRLHYRALEAAGGIQYWLGDPPATRRSYEQAVEVARGIDDKALIAQALYNLSFTRGSEGEPFLWMTERGRADLEEVLTLFREIGDRAGEGRALWALANADSSAERLDQAEIEYLQALEIFRSQDDRFHIGWTTFELSSVAVKRGDFPTAARYCAESLENYSTSGDSSGIVLGLLMISQIAYRMGDKETAFRLGGAGTALQEEHGVGLADIALEVTTDMADLPRLVEDDPEARRFFEEGRGVSASGATAEALAWAHAVASMTPAKPPAAPTPEASAR